MNFQLQYNVYTILFNIWFIAILFNQISNVGNLKYSNDSRLSNIMHIFIDICHTLFTSIPFLWSQYKNYESNIWGISSPVKFQNNQYTYETLSIFIVCGFSFIFIQRLVILMKEEMIAWYNFIKLLFILFWINFIWGNFILNIIWKIGIPSSLLITNIVWNIISKKVVTENWVTASTKLLLYNLTPLNSINNFNCQYTGFKDFFKCLTDIEHHQWLIASDNHYQSIVLILQNTTIQIGLVLFLFLQKKYGSLFFLPSFQRRKKYDSMKRDKRLTNKENLNKPWHFWTNLLWQTEFNYADNCNEESNSSDLSYYYETKWGYAYHSKWFFKYLKSFKSWPHWRCMLPKDGWDD